MNTTTLISAYFDSLPAAKRDDFVALHALFLKAMPGCRLWFLDGKDETGKTVSNPNVGYGYHTQRYADGSTKEFYQVGLSANTSGISVYLLGIDDKEYLKRRYAPSLGKASVTGYCVKFKRVSDIDTAVLLAAVHDVVAKTAGS